MTESQVFFVPLGKKSTGSERVAAMHKAVLTFDFQKYIQKRDMVLIKTHFGEDKNITHISPEVIKPVIARVKDIGGKPFLAETSTLYMGKRSDAVVHSALAFEHGFSYEKLGVPLIMVDGLLGNSETVVHLPGKSADKVEIARDAVLSDSMVIVSHPTGHIVASLGACLKNLGMGLSSRKGKMKQHSSVKPSINEFKCTFCGQCIKWCPENTIIAEHGKAKILHEKCIGCGECLAVCKFGAVTFNWGTQSHALQKRMAEYAYGAIVHKKDRCIFINVLTDMTASCDCMDVLQKPIIDDVGILISDDAVAIDQATLDLTRERNGKDLSVISQPQLDPNIQLKHAEEIGMGSRKYKLVTIE
jgi:uncharacterized protein